MEQVQDKTKEEKSQLKKLLDSYTSVAEHKLGRVPTLQDIMELVSGEESPVEDSGNVQAQPENQPVPPDESEPKIIHMKIYYGMSDGDGGKKPDPNRILFYENPINNTWFDVTKGEWCQDKPAVAEHLNSRPINLSEKDITSAMIHGIMDDDDYNELEKSNMIEDLPRDLWKRIKKIEELKSEMQKSQALEKSEEEETESSPDGSEGESEPTDVEEDEGCEPCEEESKDISEGDGSEGEYDGSSEGDFPTMDVVAEIIRIASTEVANSIMTPEFANMVRGIVREEISAFVNENSVEEQEL